MRWSTIGFGSLFQAIYFFAQLETTLDCKLHLSAMNWNVICEDNKCNSMFHILYNTQTSRIYFYTNWKYMNLINNHGLFFIYSSFNVNTIIMYIKNFIERKLNLRVQIISYSQFGSRTTIELTKRYKIAHVSTYSHKCKLDKVTPLFLSLHTVNNLIWEYLHEQSLYKIQ